MFKLKKMYVNLLSLGHPEYYKEGKVSDVLCKATRSQLDCVVSTVAKCVSQWTTRISNLQDEYKWLPFFRLAKVKRLHFLINDIPQSIHKIFSELSILIGNNYHERRKKLKVSDIYVLSTFTTSIDILLCRDH